MGLGSQPSIERYRRCLSTGAVAGATDRAKKAIADAYQGLKALIKREIRPRKLSCAGERQAGGQTGLGVRRNAVPGSPRPLPTGYG
jgi:hypothetical protein